MLIHDPPLRKPYWDIRHPRNLEFRALYPPTDSRRLAAMQREMDGSVSQSVSHQLRCAVRETRITRIGEIVFLNPHFASRYDVGYDVLLRRVLVDSVGVFGHGDYVPGFLIDGAVSRLQFSERIISFLLK